MIRTIREWETRTAALEPSADERRRVRGKVVDYAERFLNRIERLPAYNVTRDRGKGILRSPIGEEGASIDELLRLLEKHVDFPGLNPASGGHLGYIPGGGIYVSALGDYLADVANRYAGVFYAGPGAVRLENMLIRWMARLVGYPKGAGGNLVSGGSMGNLIGIVAARDARGIRPANITRSVIYLSSHIHHSVAKAIRIAGLRECVIRRVPMDERFRIRPDALGEQVRRDRKAGLNPFLVIASAGTTDVGAVDPLDAIAGVARRHGLWFHVDGAYGGFFLLTKEGGRKLRGMERSDSLVIDPHKGLFLPYGLGVVLARDEGHLRAAHASTANYMQDAVSADEETSPADVSPELTKHFRGLRLWLPLKLHGLRPFRACLEEKLLLARYFHEEVQKIGFEVGPPPELSVVTYRYVPARGDADAFNRRLQEEVVKDGRVFISSTMLNGRFTLRFACLAFRTHLRTVNLLLKILNQKIMLLDRGAHARMASRRAPLTR